MAMRQLRERPKLIVWHNLPLAAMLESQFECELERPRRIRTCHLAEI